MHVRFHYTDTTGMPGRDQDWPVEHIPAPGDEVDLRVGSSGNGPFGVVVRRKLAADDVEFARGQTLWHVWLGPVGDS